MDVLAGRAEVDASSLAFVGYSLGASIAGPLAGAEPRLSAVVVACGYGEISRRWSLRPDAHYREALAPYDGIRHAGRSQAMFLFQFARADEWVDGSDALAFHAAAPVPKRARWYDSGHALPPRAAQDRIAWLCDQFGVAPPTNEAVARVALPRGEVLRARLRRPLVRAVRAFARRRGG